MVLDSSMPKKPFSGKAKKAQLQAKRERKTGGGDGGGDGGGRNTSLLLMSKFKNDPDDAEDDESEITGSSAAGVINSKANKYRLKFKSESKKEISRNRELAQQETRMISDMSAPSEMFFDSYHSFPRRQDWSEDWSKERLERSENKYFREFVDNIMERAEDEESGEEYSYFELNLETWRQLWRVIEMSDVLLMILDVRYATATFPPSLYHHIVTEKQKHFILVLNKCDLVQPELSVAWKKYFQEKYPKLHVVFFTSFPSYNSMIMRRHGIKMKRLRANFRMAREGALQIQEICQQLTQTDLSRWRDKINGVGHEDEDDTETVEDQRYITLGTIGHPNVGKSSLINSLLGKKQVSVSRTPGHTKHFQTIFISKNVRLSDCPGLVFPSKVPKPLQVLMGSFPISQVREPYSVVNFLAQRIDLPRILKLQMSADQKIWSSFLICNGWAEFRRFFTSRTSRPDSFRAANEIMRMALEGKLCLSLQPPNYNKLEFESLQETEFVRTVLGDVGNEEIIDEEDEDEESGEESNESDNCDKDSKVVNAFAALDEVNE